MLPCDLIQERVRVHVITRVLLLFNPIARLKEVQLPMVRVILLEPSDIEDGENTIAFSNQVKLPKALPINEITLVKNVALISRLQFVDRVIQLLSMVTQLFLVRALDVVASVPIRIVA